MLICSLYPSFGKAMDYDAGDDAKWKAIHAKQMKTTDEKKQAEMTAHRFELREFLGETHVREVNLKPLP